MKTRIQLFDENRRLTAEHEELRHKLAGLEKQHVEAVKAFQTEREKLNYMITELKDKAHFATDMLNNAKSRAESCIVRSNSSGDAAFILLLGNDRAIKRLQ